MSYFDMDPASSADLLDRARQNPAQAPTAGFFDGSIKATGKGLFQGAIAQPALIAGDFATPALRPIASTIDSMFGGTSANDWLTAEREKNMKMVLDLMPTEQTGLLGQLGYGLTSVVPTAVAGTMAAGPGGGAAAVGYIQGYSSMRVAESKGVDRDTAALQGAIEGGTMAAGVLLPASVGAQVLKSIGVGVAGNVGLGVASRGGVSQLLDSRGYKEMAEQYRAFDVEAMTVDAVLGAAFGALGAKTHKPIEIPTQAIDSALVTASKHHVEVEMGLGVPADPLAKTTHTKAVEKAMLDIANDRPVDVSTTGVLDAEFIPIRGEVQRAAQSVMAELSPLGRTLDDVEVLRARLQSMGIEAQDAPIIAASREPVVAQPMPEGFSIRELPDGTGFEAVNANGDRVGYLHDNLKAGQAKEIGESANVEMVKVDTDQQGQGIGRALYEAFDQKHEGRIAPSGKTEPAAWRQWKKFYPEKVAEFVRQEVARVDGGADKDVVIGNITDPEVRARVAEGVAISQRPALEKVSTALGVPETFLSEGLTLPDITALAESVPRIGEARSAIEAGALPDLDVAQHAAFAIELVPMIREAGGVDALVQSRDLFSNVPGPEEIMLARAIEAGNIDAVMGRYYEAVEAQGDPRLLGPLDPQPPSRVELIRMAEGSERIAPPDVVPKATPEPSASKAEVQSTEADAISPADAGAAAQVLESRPNAQTLTPEGAPVPAATALAEADAAIAKAESDAPAYDAAVSCFLRG